MTTRKAKQSRSTRPLIDVEKLKKTPSLHYSSYSIELNTADVDWLNGKADVDTKEGVLLEAERLASLNDKLSDGISNLESFKYRAITRLLEAGRKGVQILQAEGNRILTDWQSRGEPENEKVSGRSKTPKKLDSFSKAVRYAYAKGNPASDKVMRFSSRKNDKGDRELVLVCDVPKGRAVRSGRAVSAIDIAEKFASELVAMKVKPDYFAKLMNHVIDKAGMKGSVTQMEVIK